MFGIGIFELLIIFVVILVCVGPDKLPDFARTMASYLGEFRRASDDLKRTVMSATDGLHVRIEPDNVIKRLSSINTDVKTEILAGNPEVRTPGKDHG